MEKKRASVISKCEERKSLDPTLTRTKYAIKDLSPISMAPTLGNDATFLQFRADNSGHLFLPMHNQYPVWYFFCGTLTEPEFLKQKLGLSEMPVLRPALINGGIARSWGGRYKALFERSAGSRVDGWTYEVASKEDEDILRQYETDRYEMVRCGIFMTDNKESIPGLTFRFMYIPS